MSRFRVHSSPDLCPSSSKDDYDDSALEGVAANVKLLLKLIHDHKDACYNKQKKDGRRMLRVATMMTILDNVRSRIQNAQFGHKKSEESSDATEPKPLAQSTASSDIEAEKLKKMLNASMAARKNLESMFSSLGKEKEIMSSELAKKVHELSEMDELISDLRAQNESLSEKLKQYHDDSSDRTSSESTHAYEVLQERNRALSEHLQRCLDAYRSLKRKLREAVEENLIAQSTVEEMVVKVRESLVRFRSFKEQMAAGNDPTVEIESEIEHLENVLERLQSKVDRQQKWSEKPRLESTMSIYCIIVFVSFLFMCFGFV